MEKIEVLIETFSLTLLPILFISNYLLIVWQCFSVCLSLLAPAARHAAYPLNLSPVLSLRNRADALTFTRLLVTVHKE